MSHLADEVNRICSIFKIPTDFTHAGVIRNRSQADRRLASVHSEGHNSSMHI